MGIKTALCIHNIAFQVGSQPVALLAAVKLRWVAGPVGMLAGSTRSGRGPNDRVLQGRFWRKDWPVLGLPDRVKPFFEFVDGYTKV